MVSIGFAAGRGAGVPGSAFPRVGMTPAAAGEVDWEFESSLNTSARSTSPTPSPSAARLSSSLCASREILLRASSAAGSSEMDDCQLCAGIVNGREEERRGEEPSMSVGEVVESRESRVGA